MNKNTSIPAVFNKHHISNLESMLEYIESNDSIPPEILDIVGHDLKNDVARAQGITSQGLSQDEITSTGVINPNDDYFRAYNLAKDVIFWGSTHSVPVCSTVENAFQQFQLYHPENKATLSLDILSQESTIASKSFIQLMVYNLLKNTLSYAPDSKHVDVIVEDADKHIRVKVVDYGSTPLSPDTTIERHKSGGKGDGTANNSTKWLMAQYGGTFTHYYTDQVIEQGTTFELCFKKQEYGQKIFTPTSTKQLQDAAIGKFNYFAQKNIGPVSRKSKN